MVCFFPPALKSLALSVPAELRNQVIAYTVPFGFLLGAGLALPVTASADRGWRDGVVPEEKLVELGIK